MTGLLVTIVTNFQDCRLIFCFLFFACQTRSSFVLMVNSQFFCFPSLLVLLYSASYMSVICLLKQSSELTLNICMAIRQKFTSLSERRFSSPPITCSQALSTLSHTNYQTKFLFRTIWVLDTCWSVDGDGIFTFWHHTWYVLNLAGLTNRALEFLLSR